MVLNEADIAHIERFLDDEGMDGVHYLTAMFKAMEKALRSVKADIERLDDKGYLE